MNTTWLHATYDLVDEIKQKNEYQRLIELQQVIQSDPILQDLITQFQKASTTYDDVKKYGSHHPDLKRVQALFAEKKQTLYSHPVVREYKTLEKQLQRTLDHISATLASSISPKIKHPNELGLIPKH